MVVYVGGDCFQSFLFGEVFHRIYGRKFCFMATRQMNYRVLLP